MTDHTATAARALTLEPAMPSTHAPTWAGAAWVGAVDRSAALAADTVQLAGATGFRRARLMVRDGDDVAGFVDVRVDEGGAVDPAELGPVLRRLPAPGPAVDAPASGARVSVVIGTRERAASLDRAVRSVLASAYDDFEVFVVDNAPVTTGTRDVVAALGDPRVHYVLEPRAGVSRARNAGLALASGTVVAFIDDDVVADPRWMAAIAAAYERDSDVWCVTGLVPSGELRTPTQRYFDERVTWARNLERRVLRTASPPVDEPLFPFTVGAFGTGANMSVRRDAVRQLGGFDVALGPGTRARAGEDPDLFTRVLLAGGALAVEPSAVVWHEHRKDRAALRSQAIGYGTGLGAWVTKLVLRPSTAFAVLRRAAGAVRRLGALGQGVDERPVDAIGGWPVDAEFTEATRGLKRAELVAALGGPWRYLAGRLTAR
ncbi:glycosyltransferase [Curtobacterium poinsettiae]|uniref:Glycosyltransferase n=1 Tax=Curtobacterium poinsettiae TaxID=159612 RepID=A0ABT3RX11_9MICO|nr:glycosyltransferase [Curtobacterium flaccumfaciens]MBT1610247.1 glycosyltransferase [Curtobacterium flaccumfaciens pv. poinsettiae]MCX2847062.1 glycosyltransferase [Curtobacterium flaccumfaciens pv. poinsettiae]MDD1384724.1 glycosyltransferase [Curtobacterium flaccumfaciens pv. poinsettiae]UXN17814.1 glycosyltransferase [Curtobacterium flaccumfaciens pv. poinsettiae]